MSSIRQLAAIMFTDIVGYTALMGEDEQNAFELLHKNRQLQRPIIEKYGGTWIKELGDGVLASFHTATDAVLCATEIQNACSNINDLKLRVGIHLGEVVFEDSDVFGDGVNIAARLQALAPVGGIWISEPVHKNVANKKEIKTKFAGEQVLKNVKEPVRIYEVIRSGADIDTKESKNKNPEKSIAVLAFVDMSPARDQEYLGDGLAEELINLLSQIRELKVIGRTSSFSFKKKEVDLKTIGQALNANTILEGSIKKAGNRVRITAQLVNSDDGYHLWSQRYDRKMDDIFDLQDDIASKIAEHLRITLLDNHETAVDKRPTSNLEAYEMFLKGDFYYKKYSADNFEKAMEYFEKAVELDSNYTDAWWYLGLLYFETHGWLYFQKENVEKSIYCAEKAISLDETNANAHFLSGLINFSFYNWKKAGEEIELGNKYTITPYPLTFLPIEPWYRSMLHGDFSFAIHQLQRGIENDPLNMIYLFHLAQINLYGKRNYKETRTLLNKMIELGFPESEAWRYFCESYLFEGQFEIAEEYARKDYHLSGAKGYAAVNLIITLASAGKKEEAQQLYQSVKNTLSIPHFPEWFHSKANAHLGMIDEAFEYLNKAIEERNYGLHTLKYSAGWDVFRADPRFKTILERMKFPE